MTTPGAHIDTEAVTQEMARVAEVFRALSQAWAAGRGAIEAGGAAIGAGRLADAMRTPYEAISVPLHAAGQVIPGLYDALAGAGSSCTTIYTGGDARGAQACVAAATPALPPS